VYNLKEAMLAKCYIEVLGLDRHSDAATRLVKWKQPVDGQVRCISVQDLPVGRVSLG
jgi:DNA ligase-4